MVSLLDDIREKTEPLYSIVKKAEWLNSDRHKLSDQELYNMQGYTDWARSILYGDFRYFVTQILGIHEFPAEGTSFKGLGIDWSSAQGRMSKFITKRNPSLDGRIYKLMLCPRESYKSLLTGAYVVHRVCTDPLLNVLWSGSKEKLVKTKEFRWIKSQFEHNYRLRRLLAADSRYTNLKGDWITKGAWTDEAIKLRPSAGRSREDTVYCGATDKVTTGKHFHLVVLDDIFTWDCISENAINHLIRYVRDILSQLSQVESAEVLVDGTRYARDDIYQFFLDQKWPDGSAIYDVLQMSIYDEEGDVQFPQFTDGKISGLKAQLGSIVFAGQYENKIVEETAAIFRSEHFRFAESLPPKNEMNVYCLTDVSEKTSKDANRTVFWIVGLHHDQKAYVIDVIGGRWEPAETARNLVNLFEHHRFKFGTVEKVRGFDLLMTIIRNECNRRGIAQIPIVAITGRSRERKHLRILGIQGRFENGDILFSPTISKQYMSWEGDHWRGEMVEEFLNYTEYGSKRQLDDYPDALSDLDKVSEKTKQRICPYPAKPFKVGIRDEIRAAGPSGLPGSEERAKWLHDTDMDNRRRHLQEDDDDACFWLY